MSKDMRDALIDNYPWTIDAIAEELGMSTAYFRVWKIKIEKDSKIAKPAIGSLLCIQDPTSKNRLLFSDAYMDKLRELRGHTERRSRIIKSAEMSLKSAVMKLTVPIFDKNIADIIMKKFKDEAGIQKYLSNVLTKTAIPAMKRIEEIKKRYEEELALAMEDEEEINGSSRHN